MDIRVDDELFDEPIGDRDRLESLIAAVNRTVGAQGRTVTAVFCDGRELDAEQLTQALQSPINEFARLELRSQPAALVAGRIFSQAAALFEETEKDQPLIVEMLNEGNMVRGMELLAGSFRLWQQAHEAVTHAVRLAGIQLDEIRIGETASLDIINGLREKLAQIKEALEARDFVMLADILQYELTETIENWKALIAGLQERIAES